MGREPNSDSGAFPGCGFNQERAAQPVDAFLHTNQSKVTRASQHIWPRGKREARAVVAHREGQILGITTNADDDVPCLGVLDGVGTGWAELNTVFVDNLGTAFIDLTAPPEPVDGSQVELLLAYGLVDSILLNCPTLHAVQILFGGREVPTLTGHLDLSEPLVLNKEFIAS